MRAAVDHAELINSLLNLFVSVNEKNRSPTLIAFGGQGNCRKTTIGKDVQRELERRGLSTTLFEIDDYAHPRHERLDGKYSGYDPRTFDVSEFQAGLVALSQGATIYKPFYDHVTGRSCAHCQVPEHAHVVQPTRLIIAIGVYPDILCKDTALRPDVAVMFVRKGISSFFSRIKRDVTQRNYTYRRAIANYRQMRRDFQQFMKPAAPCYTHICLVSRGSYRLDAQERRCR